MHPRWYRISSINRWYSEICGRFFVGSSGWWYSFTGGLVGLVLKRLLAVIQKTDPQKTYLFRMEKKQGIFSKDVPAPEVTFFFLHFGRVILLMEEIWLTTQHLWNLVNNVINYQRQLVSRISEPSTVSWVWKIVYSHFAVYPTIGLQGWESSLLCIALVATLSSESMQWKVVWRFWWQEGKKR